MDHDLDSRRNQQLGELIAEAFRAAGPVPREYRAVIAGGPPGADKAAALERLGVDRSQFLVISVGGVLTRMAESVRRSAAAYRYDEDEYQQGRGFGGRPLPPAAIEALAGPAAAAARDSIRWASGAEPASVTAGTRRAGRPGGAVTAMIDTYRRGQLGLEGLGLEFRARRWPAVPSVCPPALEPAGPAVDDLEPYVPGSFDDVVLAYDLGKLSDDEYEFLAGAVGVSGPQPG